MRLKFEGVLYQSDVIYCDIKTEERAITRLRYSKQPISITKIAQAKGTVFPVRSARIAMSPENRRTVGGGVFCAVCAEAI
jgi:hypothetical protein